MSTKYFHYHVKGKIRRDPVSGARRIPLVASSYSVDRVQERINPKGWDLRAFKTNPVLLWAHNSAQPPLGIIENAKKDGDGLYGEAVESLVNPFAKQIFDHYEAGELRAFSVGFLPLSTKTIEPDDDNGLKEPVLEYVKAELLEISAVPVPANPDALALMFTRGLGIRTTENKPGWDETESEWRYRIKDPALFDDESFRTKEIDKGVYLVLGKLKDGDGSMVAQSVRFKKDEGWTLEKAKTWYEDHKDSLKAARADDDKPAPFEPPRIVGYDNLDAALKSTLALIEKEGRVLSKKNRDKVEAARDALIAVLDADKPPEQEEDGGKDIERIQTELKSLRAEHEKQVKHNIFYQRFTAELLRGVAQEH